MTILFYDEMQVGPLFPQFLQQHFLALAPFTPSSKLQFTFTCMYVPVPTQINSHTMLCRGAYSSAFQSSADIQAVSKPLSSLVRIGFLVVLALI